MNTVYLVCFLVGLSLSVVSFASGLHRIHLHHGHHAKIGAKHGRHGRDGRVSPFNLAAITAFLAWFGGAGLVLQQATPLRALPVALVAAVTGAGGGHLVNRFLRALLRREKPLQATSMNGTIAQVTSPIRAGGTGEVVYSMNGTRHVAAARALNGGAIDKGTEVVVIRHEKGIAYVSTWAEL